MAVRLTDPFQRIVAVSWGEQQEAAPWYMITVSRSTDNGGVNYEGSGAGGVPDIAAGGEIHFGREVHLPGSFSTEVQPNLPPLEFYLADGTRVELQGTAIISSWKYAGIGAGSSQLWVGFDIVAVEGDTAVTDLSFLEGRVLTWSLASTDATTVAGGTTKVFGSDLFYLDPYWVGPPVEFPEGGYYRLDIQPRDDRPPTT